MHRGKNIGFLAIRFRLWDFVTACGAILSAATALGFLGRLWWFFDLFSHFRVQYFLGLGSVVVILFCVHRVSACVLFGFFTIANACTIVPLYLGGEPDTGAKPHLFRGLLMNVNTVSGQPSKVGKAIQQLGPDLLVLEEINDQWLSQLSAVLRAYPYSKVMTREDNFGIGVFSKYAVVSSDIRELGEGDVPSIVSEIELPQGRVTVIATHPLPPGGAENSRSRNDQLARLPALVKDAHSPVLLIGDLNVTPWSYYFQQLLRQSGLRDASKGRGVLPTWPTFLPLALIPLDYCLHSDSIHVSKIRVGPKVGSDHFPLIFDFALASGGAQPHAASANSN